ncbi:MAG: GNAT family N-acetyltransferase [Chlamydiota bacterium]|nr:GNAT family N-acetyltransferase [Chlamydiota bacterium]
MLIEPPLKKHHHMQAQRITKWILKLIRPFYVSICDNIVLIDLDKFYYHSEPQSNLNVTFKKFINHDLECVKSIFGRKVYDKFLGRMNQAYGFLVMVDEEIAGYCWSSDKICYNEGVSPFFYHIHPKENTIYFYDAYIKPGMRGRDLYSKLFQYRLMDAQERGYKKAFFFVDATNKAMLQFCNKHHFMIAGVIRYKKYVWLEMRDISHLDKVCRTSEIH